MKTRFQLATLATSTILLTACGSTYQGEPTTTEVDPVSLPEGAGGVRLDDLTYSTTLARVVVPAESSARIDLIDPDTLALTSIAGFTSVGSADEGGGIVFGNDRSTQELVVADPSMGARVGALALDQTDPDYVRYVATTSEVWVTQPGRERIQVLSLPSSSPPVPVRGGYVVVPGGPEGLTIDETRNLAFVHLFEGDIGVIDIERREMVATWSTGCGSTHGIPVVDSERGYLFAGCADQEVVLLDLARDGAVLDRYDPGTRGATILAYSSQLAHFYLRGDPGVRIIVLGVSAQGKLTPLGNFDAPARGHCMSADDRGNLWACDWEGRIVRYRDPFAASQ